MKTWYLICTLVILLQDKLQVLQVLERLKAKLQEKGDTSQNEKLSMFCETLRSPLFNQILTLQQSIKQLKGQVSHLTGFMLMESSSKGRPLQETGCVYMLSTAEMHMTHW